VSAWPSLSCISWAAGHGCPREGSVGGSRVRRGVRRIVVGAVGAGRVILALEHQERGRGIAGGALDVLQESRAEGRQLRIDVGGQRAVAAVAGSPGGRGRRSRADVGRLRGAWIGTRRSTDPVCAEAPGTR